MCTCHVEGECRQTWIDMVHAYLVSVQTARNVCVCCTPIRVQDASKGILLFVFVSAKAILTHMALCTAVSILLHVYICVHLCVCLST